MPWTAQFGEEVDQAGAADALGRGIDDGAPGEPPVLPLQRFDGAFVTRHAVLDAAAFEGGSGGARSRDHAPVARHDHLGIGAYVHQHGYAGPRGQFDGRQVGRYVAAHVAGDEGQAVDPGLRIGPEPQSAGADGERRGLPLAREVFVLDHGLVGFLADALHVEPEEEVPHGGVACHDDLVDLLTYRSRPFAPVHDLVVDGVDDGVPEFVLEGAVVGDPVHHVAAAETLGVLEGTDVDAITGLEVHEVHDHRGGAQVDREPVDVSAVLVHLLAVVVDVIPPPGDHGIERRVFFFGNGQDLGRAPQGCEGDVHVRIDDAGLAGEAVVLPQEGLRLRPGRQPFHPLLDFHDALVADAVAETGGRHLHGEVVGVVEDGSADDRGPGRRAVGHRSAGRVWGSIHGRIRPFARRLLRLPGAAVIELVVAAAYEQSAGFPGLALVAAPEPGGTLVETVLVGTAVGGLLGRVGHHVLEDGRDAVQPLLVRRLVDLFHGRM